MTKKFMRVLLTVLVLLVLSALATSALAASDNFPSKHIEVVTHSDVGGGGDLISRQVIAAGQKFVPQPMVVVNKVGAASNNMASYLVDKTDGHTINVCTSGNLTWYLMGSNNMNVLEYLTPIACMQREPSCFAVPASSKYKTMEEFVEGYKAGEVNIAGTAVGSDSWLLTAFLSNQLGVDMDYIPYSSGGELVTATIGGHVGGCLTQLSEIIDPVRGGLIRILAFTAGKRVGGEFSEIPTLQESGVDFIYEGWRGYFCRTGTSPEHVQYWADVLKKTHDEPSYQKWLSDIFSPPSYLGPEDFRKLIEEQTTIMAQLLRENAPELLREGY